MKSKKPQLKGMVKRQNTNKYILIFIFLNDKIRMMAKKRIFKKVIMLIAPRIAAS